MLELRAPTDPAWLEPVMADFDAFLLDHASCERKAAASGLWFVARYPDRRELLDPLIAFAREELEHFHQVYRIIAERGLTLAPDKKDSYIRQLFALARMDSNEHLLDKLLLSGVVEARGCERFGMVATALEEGELKDFYVDITRSEARHHSLFVRLARCYFDEATVRTRLGDLLDAEALIVAKLPFRAAVH
jgi:tRNA-(ms[2]io[6]A)-hydroxylase